MHLKRMVRFLPLVGMTDAPDGDTEGNAAARRRVPFIFCSKSTCHSDQREESLNTRQTNRHSKQRMVELLSAGLKKRLTYEGLKFDLENFHRY